MASSSSPSETSPVLVALDDISRKAQAIDNRTPNITAIVKQYFPEMPREPTQKSTIAFAFDIDGVLIKGKEPLPGASETLRELQKLNIPYIFLTNGGGLTEKDHAAKVSSRLGVDIDPDQFVQSHSPYHDLVPLYRNRRILVIGGTGNQIRDVAEAYGFNNVITASDLFVETESIHPFPEMTTEHHSVHGRRTPDLRTREIAAILVWSSPRDWCMDLQVTHDLLLSSGGMVDKISVMAGDVTLPNNGYFQDNQPKLYFCNPDFEWATQHPKPRFAQGAFRESLKGIWCYSTKGKAELEYTSIGKPTETTFVYGEKMLKRYHEKLCQAQKEEGSEGATAIRAVYMIGDNPESDIVGANSYKSRMGADWKSILVETGVYKAGTEPSHKPTYHAKNVAEAVRLALDEEGYNIKEDSNAEKCGNVEGYAHSKEGLNKENKEGHGNKKVNMHKKVDIRMPKHPNNNGGGRDNRVLQDRAKTPDSIEAMASHFGKLKLPIR
ncbi:hypothetical protein PG989_008988 [Apiospora arundinis]